MALIEADKKVLERNIVPTPRAAFCNETIDEFVGSGMECAEVTGFENLGTFVQVCSCFRTQLERRKILDVKLRTRKRRMYLLREVV